MNARYAAGFFVLVMLVTLVASSDAARPTLQGLGTSRSGSQLATLVDGSGHTIKAGSGVTIVAHAVRHLVRVYGSPFPNTFRTALRSPQSFGTPLVFVVLESRHGWMRVLLPTRPNGSSGWIRARDVRLSWHTYRIVVQLRVHRVTVYKGGVIIAREPAGIGTRETPTPSGTYYTRELIQTLNPRGPYGPYAYELSGYSTVLMHFNGGDGVIGIHGTNQPQFIGRDVSHGCIRISNAAITRLAHVLPIGVPVEIRQ